MKTSDSIPTYPRLTSSAAGAFVSNATGDPSAFIEIFGECILIDEVDEEVGPRKKVGSRTRYDPNEASKRALQQLRQGDLIEYDSLAAFKEHLRNI